MRYLMIATVLVWALALGSYASAMDPGSYQGIYYGQANNVGQGYASSWISLDVDGTPLAYGLCLTPGFLQGLPSEDASYDVALPPAMAVTGFDHVGLNWNPHGHAPDPIYGVPHFDLHFYLLSDAGLQQISGMGDDKARTYAAPDADEVPAGYILAPDTGVPWMGAHWINPASPEFNGKPFKATFIYGFYNGDMDFFEPMVAKSFLESKQPVTIDIPQPNKYPKAGYYPTRMSLSYDENQDMYILVLDKLVKQ